MKLKNLVYNWCIIGVTQAKKVLSCQETKYKSMKDMRIRRRLKQIEGLNEKEKRQVIQLLDTYIERNRLKQQVISS